MPNIEPEEPDLTLEVICPYCGNLMIVLQVTDETAEYCNKCHRIFGVTKWNINFTNKYDKTAEELHEIDLYVDEHCKPDGSFSG
jgi:DNA-directed RNA polymerase subunit M/transcription elongation factor TFIIS